MRLSDILDKDPEQLEFALKYSNSSKAKDGYKCGELVKRSFYEVKELQRLFSSDDNFFELIKFVIELFNIPKNPPLFDFFAFINFLKSEIEKVNDIEVNLISEVQSDIDPALFEPFGYLIQIDELAKGDILNYERIKALPYEVCFTKLLYEKVKFEAQQKAMQKASKIE